MPSPVLGILEQVHARCRGLTSGAVADYIPELATADADAFGIVIATADGHLYEVGDTGVPFTIQSMSKPFTYGLALHDAGLDGVMAKIGVEPTGDAFNSISVEPDTGRPLNPMINAGAITAASLIAGATPAERLGRLVDTYSRYAGRELMVDESLYRSELETGHRNRAIGHMLRTYGILAEDPEPTLDLYFHQCSVIVDCRDVAAMAATLANGGVNPLTGERAIERRHLGQVLSVMTTCGMYDAAGNWMVGVGMPAKSGVGGGVLAVLPGQLGIGVFAPPLDPQGHSVRGVAACRQLSEQLALHLLNAPRSARVALRRRHDVADVPSKRRRTVAERLQLDRLGQRAQVFELAGDVLFAGAESAVHAVTERAGELAVAVIDLTAVDVLDSAAARLLTDLAAHVRAGGGELVFVDPAALTDGQQTFADLDHATQWAEETLLAAAGDRVAAAEVTLAEHHLCAGLDAAQLKRLATVLMPKAFEPGDVLVRDGAASEAIFLVMRGEVSITIDLADGRGRRLSTLTAGMSFGEAGALSATPRSADVRGDIAGECLILPVRAFEGLHRDDPALQAALMRNMLAAAYEIVARLTREVASLSSRAG